MNGGPGMKVVHETFSLRTTHRCEMVDLTDRVEQIVRASGIQEGSVMVYCPHTTAAITINENADPSVTQDILLTLEALVPRQRAGYRHSEGNSDAHVKSSLLGAAAHVPLADGRLGLGTWQALYFCEFDGPRTRQVNVQVLGA